VTDPRLVKMPQLPTKPEGESAFAWILRMAPIVRAQRQAVLVEAKRRNGG